MSEAKDVAWELIRVIIIKAKSGKSWKREMRQLTDMARNDPDAKEAVSLFYKKLTEEEKTP